jgi:hypothetical protein
MSFDAESRPPAPPATATPLLLMPSLLERETPGSPRLLSRRRPAPAYRFDHSGFGNPEHRNGDQTQLRRRPPLLADTVAGKQRKRVAGSVERAEDLLCQGQRRISSSARRLVDASLFIGARFRCDSHTRGGFDQ